jgi:hypothetical protein
MAKTKAKRRPGRPSSYTPELAAKICARIAGGESLRSVCRDPAMPDLTTVFRWMPKRPEFHKQYDEACDARAQAMFDELVEIADTPMQGDVITEFDDGRREIKRGDMLGHRRLQVDVRKWALARMSPKRFGDKVGVEHTGTVSLEALVLGSLKREGDGE